MNTADRTAHVGFICFRVRISIDLVRNPSYLRGWSVTSNGGRRFSKPHLVIRISLVGLPRWSVSCCSMACMTFCPSTTMPNITCSPFKLGVDLVVMKNWHPFVSGPEPDYEKKYHSTIIICVERDSITTYVECMKTVFIYLLVRGAKDNTRDDGQKRSVLKLNHNGFKAQHCLVFIIYKRWS